jgi:Flp pilus assembly protein TadD
MDCRKSLMLALGLFAGVSGCQHPLMRLPWMGGTAAGKADEEIVHKPETYVSFGNFRLQSSLAEEIPPAAKAQLREDARLSYQQALVVAPNYAPAHVALGRLHLTVEDHPHAIAEFRKALEINDKDSKTWYELGMCHARQKEWAQAVECLRRAVDIDPANRTFISSLGLTQVRTGQHTEAVASLTRVHGEAQAHYLVARMLHHTNQDELARQHLIQSLTLDANSTQSRTFLDELTGRSTPMPAIRPEAKAAPRPAVQPVVYLQEAQANAPVVTPATTPPPQPASVPAVPPVSANLPAANPTPTTGRPIPIPPLPVISLQGYR